MCLGKVLSPIATSTGRAALAGGALGAIMSASGKKKPKQRFGDGTTVDGAMSFAPTAALGNSSNFNQKWYG